MPTDWLSASNAERKVLYGVAKRLLDSSPLSWESLIEQASGARPSLAPGFETNFPQGRMARRTAAQVYRWLREHEPDYADAIDDELGRLHGMPAEHSGWDVFLRSHGLLGHVEIVKLPQHGMPAVEFADAEPLAGPPLRRGERFIFRLLSPLPGAGIAFQWTHGEWFYMPLTMQGLPAPIRPGKQPLPLDLATGLPAPLSESTEMGLHRFAFVIAPEAQCREMITGVRAGVPLDAALLDGMARRLGGINEQSWRVLRASAIFVD
jgi:hypothetical protein